MPVLFSFPTLVLRIQLSVLPCMNLVINTQAVELNGSLSEWQLFRLNCLPSCLYDSINFWYNKEIDQSAARIRGTDNDCNSLFDNPDLLTRVPSFGAEQHRKCRSLNTTVLPPTG